MSRSYLPRLVDDQLTRGLRSAGAVVLEGPKACGKTTTAGEQAASVVRLDTSPQLRAAALGRWCFSRVAERADVIALGQ
jgi:uncharacterized protein